MINITVRDKKTSEVRAELRDVFKVTFASYKELKARYGEGTVSDYKRYETFIEFHTLANDGSLGSQTSTWPTSLISFDIDE